MRQIWQGNRAGGRAARHRLAEGLGLHLGTSPRRGPNSIGGRDLTRGGAGNREAFGGGFRVLVEQTDPARARKAAAVPQHGDPEVEAFRAAVAAEEAAFLVKNSWEHEMKNEGVEAKSQDSPAEVAIPGMFLFLSAQRSSARQTVLRKEARRIRWLERQRCSTLPNKLLMNLSTTADRVSARFWKRFLPRWWTDIVLSGEYRRTVVLPTSLRGPQKEKRVHRSKKWSRAFLLVGDEMASLPVRLVKLGVRWYSMQGRSQELRQRRIWCRRTGRNRYLPRYVEAQHEYALQQAKVSTLINTTNACYKHPGKQDAWPGTTRTAVAGGQLAKRSTGVIEQG